MPAARPRVSVVLDEQVHETVRRVAAVQGRSLSRVVADLVSEMEPGLRQVADMGEAFQELTAEQVESVRRAVADVDAEISPTLRDGLVNLGLVVERLNGLVKAGGRPDSDPPR